MALQSCGANVATECYQVQIMLIEAEPSWIGTTKAAQLERADGYVTLAEALVAQSVKDETLAAHQTQLVAQYRQVGELTQAQAAFMETDGSVLLTTAAMREDYDRLSQQLIAAHDGAEVEQNALQLYCSLQ